MWFSEYDSPLSQKVVELFDVKGDAVDGRLAGAVNDVVVIWERDWMDTRSEEPGEEVVQIESIILRGRVTYVFSHAWQRSHSDQTSRSRQ